jgi:protoheme IX farnesyltransferase
MAVAWTYRRDYSSVKFPMLPVRDESGRAVAGWAFIATILLVVVSLLPLQHGAATLRYGAVALVLGAWFLVRAAAFLSGARREVMARKLFYTSLAYLPLLLGALVADRLLFR